MKLTVQIPFKKLLTAVKTLSPAQKVRLIKELEKPEQDDKAAFLELLLNGPVASEEEIAAMEETRNEINRWRTKKI